jgi:hypothetical protein
MDQKERLIFSVWFSFSSKKSFQMTAHFVVSNRPVHVFSTLSCFFDFFHGVNPENCAKCQ